MFLPLAYAFRLFLFLVYCLVYCLSPFPLAVFHRLCLGNERDTVHAVGIVVLEVAMTVLGVLAVIPGLVLALRIQFLFLLILSFCVR